MWDKQSSLSATCYHQSLDNTAKCCTFILFKHRAGLVCTRQCPHSSVAMLIVEFLINRSEKNAPFLLPKCYCKPFASGNPWSAWLGQHFTEFSFQSLLQSYQFSSTLVSIGISSRAGMNLITSLQI